MHIRKIATLAVLTAIVIFGVSSIGTSKSVAAQPPTQSQTAIELQSYGPDGSCVCSSEKSEECQQISPRTHCCAIWNNVTGCRIFCATACAIY